MNLGITGTQIGLTTLQRSRLMEILMTKTFTEFHHGCCIGVDTEASILVRDMGVARIVGHPPINTAKIGAYYAEELRQPLDYLIRNKAIVDESDEIIVCPKGMEKELRSGTWATYRYAVKTKKPTTIIWRNGSILIEAMPWSA